MTKSLASKTIHRATIVKAVAELEERGVLTTTSNVGELLLRPRNYDMGGRLYNLCLSGLLSKEGGGHSNTYHATEKGLDALKKEAKFVQEYGEYKAIGADKKVKAAPSKAAASALDELTNLIETNTKLRTLAQQLYYNVDAMIKEIEDSEQ